MSHFAEVAIPGTDRLKFSLIVRSRGHKQNKSIDMVILFPLFVSSKPQCKLNFKISKVGSIESRKTNTNAISQSNHKRNTQYLTNQSAADAKRRNTNASESRLVLVLPLTG